MSSFDGSSGSAASSGPVTGEQLLAQLAAVQAGNAAGVPPDELTRVILDRLTEEIARIHADSSADGINGEGKSGSPEDYNGSPGKSSVSRYENGVGAAGGGSVTGGSSRPRPVDLWRASHEVDRHPKEKVVMTQSAWEDLVVRLNEGAKKKEMFLLQAQHKQLKDQLAGLTFTPHISEKSRKLAPSAAALPERVAQLMAKKKNKLDRIRNERAEKELAEATFKPNLNKDYKPVDNMVRKLGHLMQYEIDRRVRAEQRKALVQGKEDRELVFQPKINKNSARIVARLKVEASAVENGDAMGGAPPASPSTSSRAQKKALVDTLAGGRPLGRSYLPGHEQETFHPKINDRSRTLHRPGVDDVDVYTRLYVHGAGTKSPRGGEERGSVGGDGEDNNDASNAAGSSLSGAADGEVGRTHPRYFNTVSYDANGRQDFILRRLLSAGNSGYE